ncbi:TPA: hypothetical protein ACQ301_004417 [Yersinia enterocolitica]
MINTVLPFNHKLTEFEQLQQNTDYLPPKQQINNELLIISRSEKQLEKIDLALSAKENDNNLSASTLAMISMQQKQVVLAMLGINSEQAIAQILEHSIGIHGLRLEQIYGWANGGIDMFRSCLMLMLEGIKSEDTISVTLEDLFQLALLEIMCNSQEYGLEDWCQSNREDISHILECIGRGSHGLHEPDWDSPEKIADVVSKLYSGILSNGNIPSSSFLGQIITELEAVGGQKALSAQIVDGWDLKHGWWIGDNREPISKNISPMLRMFLLSSVLESNNLTQVQINLFLTGSVEEIDLFIKNELRGQSGEYGSASLEWLTKNTNWTLQIKNGKPQMHWVGDGIDTNDLTNLYDNLPGRELTKEELEEINRIGDQIKMIQQTLKYWVQVCNDERLAIARNL